MSHRKSPSCASENPQCHSNWRCLPLLALVLLVVDGWDARADWPEFRGPRGDGHASAPGDPQPIGLPLHWSETNNVKWKTDRKSVV